MHRQKPVWFGVVKRPYSLTERENEIRIRRHIQNQDRFLTDILFKINKK